MSCESPDRFINICVDGQPVGAGNPLPTSGGAGPGSDVVVTDIEDGTGNSVMDAANDAIRVNIVAGAGSGGTAITDEAAFTEGATSFTPIGGVFNDALASDPTPGQAAAARITSKRGLHANLRNASGTEVGTAGAPLRTDPTGTTTQPVSIVSGGGGAVTIADGADVALGATTDAAAGTDAGTFSLIALFKRLLGKFTTQFPAALVGGRFDVNIGSTAVTQPVSGTVSIGAGSAVIGQVKSEVTSINYTDAATLAITVGGNSQEMFAANASRTGLIIQNNSDEDLWINFDAAATLAPPSIRLIGGGLGIFQFPDSTGRLEMGQIQIIGATTAQAFSAKEAADA